LMSGPALKDWNRSQLDRARRVTEARRVKDEVQKGRDMRINCTSDGILPAQQSIE